MIISVNLIWVTSFGNTDSFGGLSYSYGHTFTRSPAIDTVADSIFYVATNGGAYISDYISTYSYGSPSTRDSGGTYLVYPDGIIPYNNAGYVGDSYGLFFSSI